MISMSGDENILPEEMPANNESAAENPSAIDPVSETEKSQTNNMEVHHHTHAGHGKKTWKEYFWEFLMLFLAVFCGFLAEYQLEHYIEKQRAKDFAISLHSDLAADTVTYNGTIARLNICIKKIDTLINILGDTKNITENTASIYRLSVYAFIFPTIVTNESTLQQLLNSGSLRYFKNKALVDSIKVYNTYIQQSKKFSEASSDFNTEFRKIQVRVVEINPMLEFMDRSNILTRDSYTDDSASRFFDQLKLLNTDTQLIKEYANWCALKKFYMANSIVMCNRINGKAASVLQILNR